MERTEPAESSPGSSAVLSRFAVLLRQSRISAGLTQEELAERSGVSVRAISDLERGVKLRPQRATIRLLCEGLGLTAEEQAALDAAVPSRHSPSVPRLLDLPVGGFLGAVPEGRLIARTDEVERIRGLVEAVRGGAGRLLLLSGEPGVGKTRLAQEVTLIGRANGMRLAAGRCYQPQQAVAFFPFLDIVSRLVAAARSSLEINPLQRWPQLTPLVPARSEEH